MNLLAPFSFTLPTRIEYGTGAVEKLADELALIDARRVMLITDVRLAASGLLSRFTTYLASKRIAYDIFARVEANPKEYNVEEGAKKAVSDKPDCLVAIGGGSPIDCAKAISVVASCGGRARDYEGYGKIPGEILPLIAIPTTAGSGSEVTFSAVITDSAERVKFSIKDATIAPRVALVDPEMTISMPPALTAATGMDALTHAIEAFSARAAEPLSDAVALYAVELISAHLRAAVADGRNLEARSAMMLGSLLAAIAFSHSDVAAVHCISEALGGKYDLPHGVCNAVVLPAVMEYNLDYCVERYARIALAMGLNASSAEGRARVAAAEVKKLATDIRLPDFRDLGVKEADIDELARNSAANGSNPDNPRPMSAEDYRNVLLRLTGGA
ncbi:MAG: iron-containing alcohol dehydrogenase [Desulfobacterales bacterium]